MKRPRYLDRLASWFALNVASAILVSLLMVMVFMHFAGVWAKPPLESTGLLDQAVGLTSAMDATPAAERSALAAKLTSPMFETRWYRQRDQLPPPLRDWQSGDLTSPIWGRLRQLLGRPNAGVLATEPSDAKGLPATDPRNYAIAIQLTDGSWVSFTTSQRSWGLDRGPRIALTVLFVMLASGIVASLASRRLARPVQRLARASERFGAGVRAAPLALDGPWEIREAASAFNAMQERIQQLMDSRTAMLMAISHDLRAPLTRMRLRGEFIDDAEQQRKLFRDVDDMQAMIEASLTFFRLDSQEEALSRFDLAELLHSVLDDFRDLGRPVTWSQPPQRIVYQGRLLGLRRSVTNLVDNALKYGSTARVSLQRAQHGILIRIEDDGPGVPPEMIPKLFEPFFRGEPSRNRATGGFGLGLASALSIIRAQGGDLSLANREPHGLEATITLPE